MTDRQARRSRGINNKLRVHAERNRDLYAQLPAPDADVWRSTEVFDSPHQAAFLNSLGVIEEAGRVDPPEGATDKSPRQGWRTVERVYRALDARGYLDTDRPPMYGDGGVGCPECGRCAFTNLDGERLECKPCGHVGPKEAWR